MKDIIPGGIIYLINRSGTAKDLANSLDQRCKDSVIDLGVRKIELMVPENLGINEEVANRFIECNGYEVDELVSVDHKLYIFYRQNKYKNVNRSSNASIANSFG